MCLKHLVLSIPPTQRSNKLFLQAGIWNSIFNIPKKQLLKWRWIDEPVAVLDIEGVHRFY